MDLSNISSIVQMVNESLDSNRQEVRNFFESSIQKQITIKNLFALNEAQTAMHSLRALKELTSFLSGANNCGGGDNNLLSRVYKNFSSRCAYCSSRLVSSEICTG